MDDIVIYENDERMVNYITGTLVVKPQEARWQFSPNSELQVQHMLCWVEKTLDGNSHSIRQGFEELWWGVLAVPRASQHQGNGPS